MAAFAAFLTTRAEAMEGEDGFLVLQHLLASRVMVKERSSDQMTVQGALLQQWKAQLARDRTGGDPLAQDDYAWWRRSLGAVGLRWETGREAEGWRGDGPPTEGVWIAHSSPSILALFNGSPWPGAAWREPLRDLPGTQMSKGNVAFPTGGRHRATFVPFNLVIADEDMLHA
jgi:hypothetical protein